MAQVHRLNVFHLLVRECPAGLAAGAVAAQLELPASSLSFHLSQLEHSGLVAAKGVQRNIFYSLTRISHKHRGLRRVQAAAPLGAARKA